MEINAAEFCEKVARAICEASGMNPDERVGFTGGTVADDFALRAYAAIDAVIDGLLKLDLPQEANDAADDVPFVVESWEPEFRAILTILRPILTKP
jgi:hypothetical protein